MPTGNKSPALQIKKTRGHSSFMQGGLGGGWLGRYNTELCRCMVQHCVDVRGITFQEQKWYSSEVTFA